MNVFKNIEVYKESLDTIRKFSEKIGSSPVSYRDYNDGIQINWTAPGKSYMWRSMIPEKVEVYTGDDHDTYYMLLEDF